MLRLRRENPTYGKVTSTSTVGRILTVLFEKGLITKPPFGKTYLVKYDDAAYRDSLQQVGRFLAEYLSQD